MNTIRPSVLPPMPQMGAAPAGNAQDAAKLAAAKAFFAAALGPPAATATAAPVATMAPPTTVRAAAPSTDAPQKVARPGSLFDIRV